MRKFGTRKVDEISEGNGNFPECLSELMEVDKIDVAAKLLCENKHSQTNISKATEEGSTMQIMSTRNWTISKFYPNHCLLTPTTRSCQAGADTVLFYQMTLTEIGYQTFLQFNRY